MKKLAYQDSPQENLHTWKIVCNLLGYGTAATALLLIILALTLL